MSPPPPPIHVTKYKLFPSVAVVRSQLYTVSQDGTLCVWESDTDLDGLVLKKKGDDGGVRNEDDEEERVEGEEGEVIRGKADVPEDDKKIKNVRFKQASK